MTLDLLTRLGRKLDDTRPRLDLLDTYYRGTQPLAYVAPHVRQAIGSRLTVLNVGWPQLVVDALEERLNIVGYRLGSDQPADEELWRIHQANNLDEASQQAHVEALVHGRSFILVWAGDDPQTPRITVESAKQVAVSYDPASRQVRAALKRWHEDGRGHAVVLTASEVTRWVTEHYVPVDSDATFDYPTGGWTLVDTIPNALGQVPVVPLVNRARLMNLDGESEMAEVLPLADAINKLATDLLVCSESFAMPRRWITGMDVGDNTAASERTSEMVKQKWEDANPSKLWIAGSPDTRFGQFDAATLDNFVAAITLLTAQVAALGSLPPHYVGLHADQPASADAIRSSEASLVAKARRRHRSFGGAWEHAMRLAVLVRDGSLKPGMESLEVIWGDPETRTVAQAADAATKLASIGVPLGQLLEDLGYSPVQIERMQTMKREEVVEKALTAIEQPQKTAGGIA